MGPRPHKRTRAGKLLLLVLHGWANVAGAAKDEPERLLWEALSARSALTYEVTRKVVIAQSYGERIQILHEVCGPGGCRRVEYRSPGNLAGMVVVTDGRVQWQYDPRRKRAVRGDPSLVESDTLRQVRQIRRNYTVSLERSSQDTAGRPCRVVRLTPKARGKETVRLWVDPGLGLLLGKDQQNASGRLTHSWRVTRIKVVPPAPSCFCFSAPPGVRVVRAALVTPLHSLADVRHTVRWPARLPGSLDPGYVLRSAFYVAHKREPSLTLQYSDGLSVASLVQGPAAPDTTPVLPEAVETSVAGQGVELRVGFPSSMVHWTSEGVSHLLIAEVSPSLLQQMATSASRAPLAGPPLRRLAAADKLALLGAVLTACLIVLTFCVALQVMRRYRAGTG